MLILMFFSEKGVSLKVSKLLYLYKNILNTEVTLKDILISK
ncbi:hypothetical protein GSEF_0687 [Staphylococcus epidermidis FRI909]|nr:hypothetical protein GSEF_0687 [Staphylococcus epidermidis FRI909]